MVVRNNIFQIKNIDFPEVLEYLTQKAEKKQGKTFVVTINPEIIMFANSDPKYEKVIKSADLAVPDGVGVLLAGKLFGKAFKQRIHGVDLVEKLSEAAAKKPITVGFIGGYENVAQKTADCLVKKFPGLRVSIADSNFEIRNSKFEIPQTDILFVAFGSPKQEKWIYENMNKIDARVFIGVGGAFDFISGKVRRAPVWVRNLGLEWLFRLIIQPWRIKRQLSLPKFVILILKERFFKS